MKIKQIGSNKTELETTNHNGSRVRVLFSYSTPVAAAILESDGTHYFKTEENYSRTTSKHIGQWLPTDDAKEMPQTFFDGLVG